MVDTKKFANDPKQGQDGTLQVGVVLQSRYKITGVLGVGGMGSVYLARDMNFPDVVRNAAVKEMLNLASDQNLRETALGNFRREANLLAELVHPAIPRIFDYFPNRDRAYLVMEYINGRDLEGVVNSMQDFLPFDMVKKWALELCDVLNYLHSYKDPRTGEAKQIIFRDMKPSNVMIDSLGNVRLIDFGIAKTFQANQKGTMIGTEGYSPPEQYRGEASPGGDLYALGATLHHILTRKDPRLEPPFSFIERPIRATNAKVPEEFEKIVMRALAYQVADRFPSAAAMRDAINNMNQAITLVRSAPGSSADTTSAKVGAGPHAGSGDSFEEVAGVKALWKFKCEGEIRSTPVVNKNMIYVGASDNNLYALSTADGSFKWKFPTDGRLVGGPGIAVDEGLVVFGSEDNNLYAVDMRTGKLAWTFQTGGMIRSSVNIAVGHVFFGSDDGKLYAIRLATGRLAWKAESGAPIRSRPAVTSERVIAGAESGDVIGVDLAGTLKWRFKAKRAVTSSPVVQDDIAYFGSMDWHVYAVDVANGWTAWRYRTAKPVIAAPLVVGKALYIGSADNIMYALDITANGRELWKFETGGQLVSGAAHSNGSLYFGSVDKKIYSVDTKKGKLRWAFETEGAISAAPLLIDRTLYVGSTDHFLYALNA